MCISFIQPSTHPCHTCSKLLFTAYARSTPMHKQKHKNKHILTGTCACKHVCVNRYIPTFFMMDLLQQRLIVKHFVSRSLTSEIPTMCNLILKGCDLATCNLDKECKKYHLIIKNQVTLHRMK